MAGSEENIFFYFLSSSVVVGERLCYEKILGKKMECPVCGHEIIMPNDIRG